MPTTMRRKRIAAVLASGLLLAASVPGSAQAQHTGDRGHNDPPGFSVTVRGGIFVPRAESDVYDFMTERLTLSRSDFRSGTFGLEVAYGPVGRFEVLAGADAGSVTRASRFIADPAEAGEPVQQNTRLRTGPGLHVGARAYLLAPQAVEPAHARLRDTRFFLTAGGGLIRYELHQWGRFVDEVHRHVFTGEFRSAATGSYALLGAGVEIPLLNRADVTAHAAYHWGAADLGVDYRGFEPIDLSGLRIATGLKLRL